MMPIHDTNRSILLARSKFRSRFKLDMNDLAYIKKTGEGEIRDHAVSFIQKRLAPAKPANDGRQTPFKGHPVFKAQHATASCCRGCLQKWYNIPASRELSPEEIEKVADTIMTWIRQHKNDVRSGNGT